MQNFLSNVLLYGWIIAFPYVGIAPLLVAGALAKGTLVPYRVGTVVVLTTAALILALRSVDHTVQEQVFPAWRFRCAQRRKRRVCIRYESPSGRHSAQRPDRRWVVRALTGPYLNDRSVQAILRVGSEEWGAHEAVGRRPYEALVLGVATVMNACAAVVGVML